MPRVRPLTEALRSEQKQREQANRTKNIVTGAARCAGMSLKDLARLTGIRYETLLRHLNNGRLPTTELSRIGNVLSFDLGTFAACCGSPEPCRFEKGGAM